MSMLVGCLPLWQHVAGRKRPNTSSHRNYHNWTGYSKKTGHCDCWYYYYHRSTVATSKRLSNHITGPEGSRRLRLQDFKTAQEGGKVSLTCRPHLTSRKYTWYSFLLETELTSGLQWGQKDYVKNSIDTIGNWTRNLPACSTVP